MCYHQIHIQNIFSLYRSIYNILDIKNIDLYYICFVQNAINSTIRNPILINIFERMTA